jgi:hypothetical protein
MWTEEMEEREEEEQAAQEEEATQMAASTGATRLGEAVCMFAVGGAVATALHRLNR